jgi:hypothetical protein
MTELRDDGEAPGGQRRGRRGLPALLGGAARRVGAPLAALVPRRGGAAGRAPPAPLASMAALYEPPAPAQQQQEQG